MFVRPISKELWFRDKVIDLLCMVLSDLVRAIGFASERAPGMLRARAVVNDWGGVLVSCAGQNGFFAAVPTIIFSKNIPMDT